MPSTNRLANETSPYLLQHAHNPVDWYPWGEEAFERAMKEDKPVLVSIGYAACHWCHVMERESFEKEEVAEVMNANFINIKVDREERPDVDHLYMDAVQAMTGSGGWPLNVFLTPDKKPFYGGTYYPPQPVLNRASWLQILNGITEAYRERRDQVQEQSAQLMEHLHAQNGMGLPKNGLLPETGGEEFDQAFEQIMKSADREWGGFGKAPKFPQTFTISFLLRYADVAEKPEALQQALLSLDKMLDGGIYDQIGGGFARYSTDTEWLAPHFEKMLYDNALLAGNLAEAWQFTRSDRYRKALEETLAFVERELMHEEGGFFSALDADSEGIEGKFYVWSRKEVEEVLGTDAEIFCAYYDITEKGNWEGENIPRVLEDKESFAKRMRLNVSDLDRMLEEGKAKLLSRRSQRVRPQLDDKVILGWNALMNRAFSQAYAATGDLHYREVAEQNMDFLLRAYPGSDGLWLHTWKNGKARHPAFLDDYANLIAALIELGQVTGESGYWQKAAELAETVTKHFSDEEASFFYYTHKEQKDILLRKKDLYDGATPSGNSLMAWSLYRLSVIFDRTEWRERSQAMVGTMIGMATKYPTSFGVWLSAAFEMISGTDEIAIVGERWKDLLREVLDIYLPHRLVQAAPEEDATYPLLRGRKGGVETLIYLCRNYACRKPVTTIPALKSLL